MKPGGRKVRVVVWLDPSVLERLELIVADKPGAPRTRSGLVREACAWMMAREAAWLVRAEAARTNRERREAEQGLTLVEREARDQVRDGDVVDRALVIAEGRSLRRTGNPPRRVRRA